LGWSEMLRIEADITVSSTVTTRVSEISETYEIFLRSQNIQIGAIPMSTRYEGKYLSKKKKYAVTMVSCWMKMSVMTE